MKVTKLNRGASWRLRIELPAQDGAPRRFRYVSFKGTEAEAEVERSRLESELTAGRIAEKPAETLAPFLEAFIVWRLSMGHIQATTARSHRLTAKLLVRLLGDVSILTITKRGVEAAYADAIAGGISPATIKSAHNLLKPAFAKAKADGLLLDDPMSVAAAPRGRADPRRPLTDKETKALLEYAGGTPIGFLVRFALGTGLRRGELAGLKWSDIGEDGVARVSRVVALTDDGNVTKSPKTKTSRRGVTLPPSLLSECQERRGDDDAPVFPNADGEHRSPGGISVQIVRMMAEIGIKGASLHSLRHTHATKLLRSRQSPNAVSRRLGHASMAVTLSVYGHAMPEDDAALAQSIDAVFAGTVPATGTMYPDNVVLIGGNGRKLR